MHENGIVHCDLKPNNFLVIRANSDNEQQSLSEESQSDESNKSSELFSSQQINRLTKLKLLDFGLSHVIYKESGKAFIKYSCGTHKYQAPEVKDVRN